MNSRTPSCGNAADATTTLADIKNPGCLYIRLNCEYQTAEATPETIMQKFRYLVVILVSVFFIKISSCKDQGARMAVGFRLPEGNSERGQAAFLQMKCHQCHPVAGILLPNSDAPMPISMELGGVVRKVKTYGELVTSIIQPQHVVSSEYMEKLAVHNGTSSSPMPSFNDTMSVTQLTDIVTFLHERYLKAPPSGGTYPYYIP
jgi:mono/diheme cytochrome c family protein